MNNMFEFKESLQRAGLAAEEIEQYLTLLNQNGFENETLLKTISLDDLAMMGVKKLGHAKAIVSAAKKVQRIKVPKRHSFYISHDKVDAGTEASMFVDAAMMKFPDKLPFIDSDHRYLKTGDDFLNALLASNFCLVLLTPRYLSNVQCIAEIVWAIQTETPICIVVVERLGLGNVYGSWTLEAAISNLSPGDWEKLISMNILRDQVHSAMTVLFQGSRSCLLFQPHETRETRAGFFLQLWRHLGSIAASEAGAQVYAIDEAVEVRWRKGAKWYPGHISEIAPNGTYSISYEDGDSENEVTAEFMRQRVRPPIVFFHQDERVEARWKRRESYFAGRVVAVHPHLNAYDIVYDDGDVEFRVRCELMRKLNRIN